MLGSSLMVRVRGGAWIRRVMSVLTKVCVGVCVCMCVTVTEDDPPMLKVIQQPLFICRPRSLVSGSICVLSFRTSALIQNRDQNLSGDG